MKNDPAHLAITGSTSSHGRQGGDGPRLAGAAGAGRPAARRVVLAAGALADPGGAGRSLSAHCEVAAMLARRLDAGPAVRHALAHGYERWDGAGFPGGLVSSAVEDVHRVNRPGFRRGSIERTIGSWQVGLRTRRR